MRQRPRVPWLPLLLSLYLLAIVIFIIATRGETILAGHPAYPILLTLAAFGVLATLVIAVLRRSRA